MEIRHAHHTKKGGEDRDVADLSSEATLGRLALGNGLTFQTSGDPCSALFDEFFAGYDRSFVLPDEREEPEGFRACLALNRDCPRMFGRPHLELVGILREDGGCSTLGGANFLIAGMPQVSGHPRISVALNYLFVSPEARGRGLSRILLRAIGDTANRAAGQAATDWPAIFIEQNDPLMMSAEEYRSDSRHSGIDQLARLRVWERLGTSLVDFPYVQPALSADQASDDGLAFGLIGDGFEGSGNCLSPLFLHAHLQSFFGFSVLKGREPDCDPVAARQLALCRALADVGESVPLLPMGNALDRMENNRDWPRGTPLRIFARNG